MIAIKVSLALKYIVNVWTEVFHIDRIGESVPRWSLEISGGEESDKSSSSFDGHWPIIRIFGNLWLLAR